jgi:hypothetical protein
MPSARCSLPCQRRFSRPPRALNLDPNRSNIGPRKFHASTAHRRSKGERTEKELTKRRLAARRCADSKPTGTTDPNLAGSGAHRTLRAIRDPMPASRRRRGESVPRDLVRAHDHVWHRVAHGGPQETRLSSLPPVGMRDALHCLRPCAPSRQRPWRSLHPLWVSARVSFAAARLPRRRVPPTPERASASMKAGRSPPSLPLRAPSLANAPRRQAGRLWRTATAQPSSRRPRRRRGSPTTPASSTSRPM